MKKIRFLFAFLSMLPALLPAQATLSLKNPSFEGEAGGGRTPDQWEDCGFLEESPPDVHPCGQFGVTQQAADGQSFLGLVARDNDSWECVGQQLQEPLQADSCYQLILQACRSEKYESFSQASGQPADFNTPLLLRLWAGFKDKNREGFELLTETPAIAHTDWREYSLSFSPGRNYDYLYLEAYYDKSRPGPYNGNVLVDDLSALGPCSQEK